MIHLAGSWSTESGHIFQINVKPNLKVDVYDQKIGTKPTMRKNVMFNTSEIFRSWKAEVFFLRLNGIDSVISCEMWASTGFRYKKKHSSASFLSLYFFLSMAAGDCL